MSQGKTGMDNVCGRISSEGHRGTKAEQLSTLRFMDGRESQVMLTSKDSFTTYGK
jgi:hypothetical protein